VPPNNINNYKFSTSFSPVDTPIDCSDGSTSFSNVKSKITVKRNLGERKSIFAAMATRVNEHYGPKGMRVDDMPVFVNMGPYFKYPDCRPLCTHFEQVTNTIFKELESVQGRIYEVNGLSCVIVKKSDSDSLKQLYNSGTLTTNLQELFPTNCDNLKFCKDG
jgi:dihydroorotate dehydrogenase